MDSLVDLIQSFTINTFGKDSSHWVDVTHINDPQCFYVRPTIFRVYMKDLQSRHSKLELSDVHLGEIVIYKSKKLNEYVRGQILKIENIDSGPCFKLYAVDFGCEEVSVSLRRLRKPTINTSHIPPLALHCQLADCFPIGNNWDERSIAAMKCYVGTERAKMWIREPKSDIFIVELINTCPDDIATMLVNNDYACLGYDLLNRSRLDAMAQHQYYTHQKLNVGDRLHVRTQSGKSLDRFYVCPVSEYNQHLRERNDFTKNIKAYKSTLRQEDVAVGQAYAVLNIHNEYERAIVKEIDPLQDKFNVQLVDSGKIVAYSFECFKSIPPFYLTKPVLAIYCKIEERQMWNNDLLKYLCPNYEFIIEIKELGDKHNTPNIVKIIPLDSV